MSQEDEHALIKQKRGLIFGDSRSYWQQAYLISLDMMHMKNFWKIFLLYLKKKKDYIPYMRPILKVVPLKILLDVWY